MIIDRPTSSSAPRQNLLEVVRDITGHHAAPVCFLVSMEQFALRSRAPRPHRQPRGEGGRAAAHFRSRTSGHGRKPEPGRHPTTPCCRSSSSRAPAAYRLLGAIANLEAWADSRWEAHHARARRVARSAPEFSGKSLEPPRPAGEVTRFADPHSQRRDALSSRWASGTRRRAHSPSPRKLVAWAPTRHQNEPPCLPPITASRHDQRRARHAGARQPERPRPAAWELTASGSGKRHARCRAPGSDVQKRAENHGGDQRRPRAARTALDRAARPSPSMRPPGC